MNIYRLCDYDGLFSIVESANSDEENNDASITPDPTKYRDSKSSHSINISGEFDTKYFKSFQSTIYHEK